jgi:flagellar basal body rod protein FlgC
MLVADINNMDLSAIALQGLQQADVQLEAAAANLANAGANSAGPSLDTVDLATQIVALNSAQNLFAVNLDTLKTADQVQQSVLNLLA